MRFFDKLRTYGKVLRRARRPIGTLALLRTRPALLLGVNAFELAQLACGRVDARLKALAQIKTSALIGCPF
jgi:alkylhydroperoxidase family enzyme